MRRVVGGMTAGALALGGGVATARPMAFRHHHLCHRCFIPLGSDLGAEAPFVALPYGGYAPLDEPSGGGSAIPYQWDDGRTPPADNPPYPQGFVLTISVGRDRQTAPPATSLNRYIDVAQALGRCWSSDLIGGDWTDATLRVSFKRDGSVNGVPVIPHISAANDTKDQSDVRTSLLAALSHCTPLHFSPSLGQAIAGQVFAIRFVQARNS